MWKDRDRERYRITILLDTQSAATKTPTMKYLLAAAPILLCQATAFTMVANKPLSRAIQTRIFAGDYAPMEGEGKINLKVRDVV